MRENVTVIDITTQVTDNTGAGAASSISNVSRLEQTMQRAQRSIERMRNMSRIELTAHLADNASRGIDAIFRKGRSLAGKAWTVTMRVADFATAPIRGVMNLLQHPVFRLHQQQHMGRMARFNDCKHDNCFWQFISCAAVCSRELSPIQNTGFWLGWGEFRFWLAYIVQQCAEKSMAECAHDRDGKSTHL